MSPRLSNLSAMVLRLFRGLAGRGRLARRGLRILAGALALVALGGTVALADGDPASDVLLGEDVFYPYSPPVTVAVQKTLGAETTAARKVGFGLKVALSARRLISV